jgi:hypothetical protein
MGELPFRLGVLTAVDVAVARVMCQFWSIFTCYCANGVGGMTRIPKAARKSQVDAVWNAYFSSSKLGHHDAL